MRRWLIGLIVVLWAMPAYASKDCTNPAACTVTCDGVNDHTDINDAINEATAGGTVTIGAGSCGIAGTVTLNKYLTLAGAGSSLTTFTGAATPVVNVTSSYVRVTGIYFSSAVDTQIKLTGPIYQVRVDTNKFALAYMSVYATGTVEGVVDTNEFVNCDECVMLFGADAPAWSIDYNATTGNFVAGGSHALFIDHNTFTRNASLNPAYGNEIHYSQYGARSVFRYNTVDFTAYSGLGYAFDIHGNGKYYSEAGDYRGPPITEVYENTFRMGTTGRTIALRGGSMLFWNNTITAILGYIPRPIGLWEEEAFSGDGKAFSPPRGFDTTWPNEDMLTNAFFWGNTWQGAALTTANFGAGDDPPYDCCGTYSDATKVLNWDRDLWLHAPEATGGRTYYTDRAGASGRGADGTLAFTQSGANAFYPYTPYTYPHPLAATPPAPSAVTVAQISTTLYLQWEHSGVGAQSFRTVLDGVTTTYVGVPLVSGTTFRIVLPTLTNGAHTLVVQACNGTGCIASATLSVVKLEP